MKGGNLNRICNKHIRTSKIPYVTKHLRGKTFAVEIEHGKTFAVAASYNSECLWLVNYSS